MDSHGSKNLSKFLASRNNKIYMDLKLIIREHALQFLPAKSLFRFRGVCRDWRIMISTPFFAHNQSLSFKSVSGVFFQNPGESPTFISLDPLSCGLHDPALIFLPVPVDIVASSNGLLVGQAQTGDRAYYICNPVTKQFKKLPLPNADHGREPAVVLIFKPSLLNFVAEYKLVCAFRSVDFDDATEFEIYSSKDDKWNVSGEINFAVKKLIPKSGVCVNDVVYWQSINGNIFVFDTTKDRSQVIHAYYSSNGTLGEFNGKLCSAYINGHTLMVNGVSNMYVNTMQMSSRAKLWDEKVKINLAHAIGDAGAYDPFTVLYVGSERVLISNAQKVYVCDLKTKQVKFLVEAPQANRRVVPYVNSLVAL